MVIRPNIYDPAVVSLLEADFYKYPMGNFVSLLYPNTPVVFGLTNRTKGVRLAEEIPETLLREHLDHIRTLRFGNTALHFLRGTNEYGRRMFEEPYLEHLRQLRLPDYELKVVDGQFDLKFPGNWDTVIYWETLALAVINELYYRTLLSRMTRIEQDGVFAEGVKRLEEKIKILRKYPGIKFSNFGQRRRFSRAVEEYVTEILASELPNQFVGCSNTFLAQKYDLMPMGTNAHELPMGISALMGQTDEGLIRAQGVMIAQWLEMYGEALSIILPDTYGRSSCFRAMTPEQIHFCKGFRHDSDDPFVFGNDVIALYKSVGMTDTDIQDKLIVFSDGLELPLIIKLYEYFAPKIKVSFGWGTNLTNDLGLKALSMVIKLIMAGGRPTVKLSDNLGKHTGPESEINRYKRVHLYGAAHQFVETKY